MSSPWRPSERLTDRELELFELVAELQARLLLIDQRNRIAETEQTHRREPLDRDAARHAHLVQVEVVFGPVAAPVAELCVAEEIGLTRIDEQRQPRGARHLGAERDDRFELSGNAGVATVRIAERIARPERAILEAAYRVAAAGEDVLVRRNAGGVAESRAVSEVGRQRERNQVDERNAGQMKQLLRTEIRHAVRDRAARWCHAQVQAIRTAARRKQRAITAVVTPAGGDLEQVQHGAEHRILADAAKIAVAVVAHPVAQLRRTTEDGREVGVTYGQAETRRLVLRQRIPKRSCGAVGFRGKLRERSRQAFLLDIRCAQRARNIVGGEVRIGVRDAEHAVVLSTVDVDRQALAAA